MHVHGQDGKAGLTVQEQDCATCHQRLPQSVVQFRLTTMLTAQKGIDPVPRPGKGVAIGLVEQPPLQLLDLGEYWHSRPLLISKKMHDHLHNCKWQQIVVTMYGSNMQLGRGVQRVADL